MQRPGGMPGRLRRGPHRRFAIHPAIAMVAAVRTVHPDQERIMPEAIAKARGTGNKPGKPVAPVTVTLKQVAAELAEKHELTKRDAEAILGDLVVLTTR